MLNRLALNTDLFAAVTDGVIPEWVELIPQGPTIVGRDGRTWTFDGLAATNVIDAFAQRGLDLAIDRNHSIQLKAPKGEESPAAAWIDRLELRDGAMWGHVMWTDRGADQVGAREYRWLSPVFDFDPTSKRIVRLVSAGLTNTPNLHLTALNHEESHVNLSVAVAAALGVPTTASDDVTLAAIQQLKTATASNNEAPSLEQFVPRADYDALRARAINAESTLAAARKSEHDDAVATAIDRALKAGKITPATADYHRASCADQGGLERFRAFVAAAPVVAPDASDLDKRAERSSTALNSEEHYVATALGIPVDAFKDSNHG